MMLLKMEAHIMNADDILEKNTLILFPQFPTKLYTEWQYWQTTLKWSLLNANQLRFALECTFKKKTRVSNAHRSNRLSNQLIDSFCNPIS